MRAYILLIFCFCIAAGICAQSDSLSYSKANALYESRNYGQAITSYESILKQKGSAPEIYYNLGNAYYKNGQMGRAILNFERCLKMQPGNDDAVFNLGLANLRIKDQLDPVEELFIIKWWKKIINVGTAKFWSIFSIISIWLAIAAFCLYRISKNLNRRKLGFYTFILFFFLFAVLISITFSKISYDKKYRYAVVITPSAIVKSGPSESETNLTIIHEGLKMQLLDTDGGWTKVKMENGVVGWLMNSAIENI